MAVRSLIHWLLIPFSRTSVQCLLLMSLAELSASDHSVLYVFSHVGQNVMLPCNWTSLAGESAPPSSVQPYLAWENPMENVFEMQGSQRYEAPGYRGRVEVRLPEFEKGGDCSLRLLEARFSDAGLYRSFVRTGRSWQFVRSVNLSVREHEHNKTLVEGQPLFLKLHTNQASTIVFRGNDSAEWEVLWQRGDGGRRQKRQTEGESQLVRSAVKLDDSGTYKVLDPQGLTISTLHLTVEAEVKSLQPLPDERTGQRYISDTKEHHSVGFRTSSSSLLLSIVLFYCHNTF